MSFFGGIGKIFRNVVVPVGLAVVGTVAAGGNPLGGAAAVAAYQGGRTAISGGSVGDIAKNTAIGAVEGYSAGVGFNSISAGISAVGAANTAASTALGAGVSGPVASGGLSFAGEASVFSDAASASFGSTYLGKAIGAVSSTVSAASNVLGSKTATNTASLLSAAGGVVGAASSLEAARASSQGGTPALPTTSAPQNDPTAIATANQAAQDEIARKRRGASANILTSPLGIGAAGQSASQQLLG